MDLTSSLDKYCGVCDPSTSKAEEWCTECREFLCSGCLKCHRVFKLLKQHITITIEQYKELPEFVKTLSYNCPEHEEQLDSYCSVHRSPCCMRCALTTHKACDSIVPLKDFISNAKVSPSLLDLEQNIKDLFFFIESLKLDKRKSKEEIQNQKTQIREEVSKIRASINDHINKLESKLIETVNDTVTTCSSETEELFGSLNEISQRIEAISSDLTTVKEHGSNLQIFLTIPYLSSLVLEEEKSIDLLRVNGKLNSKCLVISSCLDKFKAIKSLVEIKTNMIENKVNYKKEKTRQAQFIGTLKRKSTSRINLTSYKKIATKAELSARLMGYHSVSGCCIINHKFILYSEYNSGRFTDRLVLTDFDGIFVRSFTIKYPVSRNSYLDVVSIDENTIVVSCGSYVCIYDIDKQRTVATVSKQKSAEHYFGITYYNHQIYFSSKEGLYQFDLQTESNKVIVDTVLSVYSYLCCDGGKIYFTCGNDSVKCCDLSGTSLWQYEDTSMLQLARGIVVDKNGFVYVAGENSGNIVVLSPDGLAAKELCKYAKPRAMCYDRKEHRILVCDTTDKAMWFQIKETN